MHRMEARERRARLGLRHRLAPEARAAEPPAVARSLVAVHSTDPSSVYVGLLSRMAGGSLSTVEHALYQDRTLIRLLGMRRTVFVTTLDLAALIQAACGRAVAARERRKVLGWLAESGAEDPDGPGASIGPDGLGASGPGGPDRWLAEGEQAALRALVARGEATAAELAADDPRLQTEIVLSRGKSYQGRQNISSRVLFLLAAQGLAVRGRPRGSWTSHQYRWSPLTLWCPDGLADWTTEDAEVELARRWLQSYGPATADDLQWWMGWTKTQTRRVLTELRPAEVDLDGEPGIVLPDDLAPGAGGGGRGCIPPVGGARPGTGIWAGTGRGCSTGPGTSGRPCGGTAGSSAAGPRTRTARSCAASWRTSGPMRWRRPTRPRPGWPRSSGRSGSPPGPGA